MVEAVEPREASREKGGQLAGCLERAGAERGARLVEGEDRG